MAEFIDQILPSLDHPDDRISHVYQRDNIADDGDQRPLKKNLKALST